MSEPNAYQPPAGDAAAPPPTEPALPAQPAAAAKGNPLASVVGAAIGVVASRYFGANLIIPGLVGGLAIVLLLRLLPAGRKAMIPALGIAIGHLSWMLVGIAIVRQIAPVLPDVVLLSVGVTWLALAPSIAPVVVLAGYSVWGLIANVNALQFGTPQTASMVLHITLRLGLIAALVWGFVALRRAQGTPVRAQ